MNFVMSVSLVINPSCSSLILWTSGSRHFLKCSILSVLDITLVLLDRSLGCGAGINSEQAIRSDWKAIKIMYVQTLFYSIRYKCALTTQNTKVSLAIPPAHCKYGGCSCVWCIQTWLWSFFSHFLYYGHSGLCDIDVWWLFMLKRLCGLVDNTRPDAGRTTKG